VLVRGAVPGSRGGYVRITDAIKRALPKEAPHPAGVKPAAAGEAAAAAPEPGAEE
jgi:large subunit ribosomal protein L3